MSDGTFTRRAREVFERVRIHPGGTLLVENTLVAGTDPLQLQSALYAHFYSRAATVPLTAHTGADLTPELSAANAGRPAWHGGWSIGGVLPNGGIVAVKDGLRCTIPAGLYAADGNGVAVLFPHQSMEAATGFYQVFSEAPLDDRELSSLVRLYWNVEERGASALVGAVTELLNRYEIPFRFKVLRRAGTFVRSDAAVLYIGKRSFQFVARLLPEIIGRVGGALRERTPLFTKPLCGGVGLAEDPLLGDSFGLHRTRLLAQAIWNALAAGSQSPDVRLAALQALFAEEGLSLERPYLNPGSADWYDGVAVP